MVKASKKNIYYLSARGFKQIFNIMKNVAYKAITIYPEIKDTTLQLVEPHNHQDNSSERAIQIYKNNFISGLCIRDPKFPTVFWSYLVRQVQYSLNMLRTSRVYPKLSAYHILEGIH